MFGYIFCIYSSTTFEFICVCCLFSRFKFTRSVCCEVYIVLWFTVIVLFYQFYSVTFCVHCLASKLLCILINELSSSSLCDLSRPPRGVITPSFHATPPPTIWNSISKWVIRGCLQGGVYVIVMEWVINVVKYWHEPIYLLYETNSAPNLVILFSGILLKLLPPDVIFCS